MKREAAHFADVLPSAPLSELRAVLVRRVPLIPLLASAPVDFLFTSGKAYRFNLRSIGCVYFAEDEVTATAEYERHQGNRGPFATYYAEVRLRRLLDLGDARTFAVLGLKDGDLQSAWRGARTPTATQCLGEAVNTSSGISAIRYPSDAARAKGFVGANLVIFRECVQRPDRVHILGPTRSPLQKWP